MSLRWYTTVIDCHDVQAQARWWAQVLGLSAAYEAEDEVVLVPAFALEPGFDVPVERRGPGLTFVPVPEDKAVKNRGLLGFPWVRGVGLVGREPCR